MNHKDNEHAIKYRLPQWQIVLKSLILILIGIILGWYGQNIYSSRHLNKVLDVRQLRLGQQSTHSLINPLIACDISDQDFFQEYKRLKQEVASFIDQAIDSGKIMRASLYFRDINRGEWAGVNETETYIPASLVKIPLMISYYKLAETSPHIFDRIVTFESDSSSVSRQVVAPPPVKLKAGLPYSIRELLKRMIDYSDNDAYRILGTVISQEFRTKVYSDLGFELPSSDSANSETMSVKAFSMFFRILYNASYLNRQSSNEALEELTQTNFKDGIVSGVPTSTVVAHKFGERTVTSNGVVSYRELHDCGIVYLPEKPYLLCIMTQGSEFNSLKEVISGLSSLIYKEVSDNL